MLEFLNVDRVAFSIKGYDIYWYGVIICCAIVIAILVASLYSKKRGYGSDMPMNIALVVLPTGILGARLFSVIFEESLDFSEFFNFRTGGLSIIGGIIFGALGLLIYCLIKKDKDIFKYFDVLVVALILAQAIGRWGNYFNQEVYGLEIPSDLWCAFFPITVTIDGSTYMALFFYESVCNLIGFGILTNVYFNQVENGYTTSLYLIYYGVIRAILEPLRNPNYILTWNSIKVSSVMSFAMIIVGMIIYIAISVKAIQKSKVRVNG